MALAATNKPASLLHPEETCFIQEPLTPYGGPQLQHLPMDNFASSQADKGRGEGIFWRQLTHLPFPSHFCETV